MIEKSAVGLVEFVRDSAAVTPRPPGGDGRGGKADVTLDPDPNQPQPNDTPCMLSFTSYDGVETALFGGNETLINQSCFEGGKPPRLWWESFAAH